LEIDGNFYNYAVVDGKQRLDAIWGFISGDFTLGDNFEYFQNPDIRLSNLTYRELGEQFPDIKNDFDSYRLDVMSIRTDEQEIIEDLFSRLNEAVPLNAAEKRNAKPGPMPDVIRELVRQPFFQTRLPFSNNRYRHFDLAAKFFLLARNEEPADTKKAYLDRLFESYAARDAEAPGPVLARTIETLTYMSETFVENDTLLKTIGMVSVYFLLFDRNRQLGRPVAIDRSMLLTFEQTRADNRERASENEAEANYQLLEFDRYAQSPNDGIALRYRMAVIDRSIFGDQLGFAGDRLID
jgi:hypothetical protein